MFSLEPSILAVHRAICFGWRLCHTQFSDVLPPHTHTHIQTDSWESVRRLSRLSSWLPVRQCLMSQMWDFSRVESSSLASASVNLPAALDDVRQLTHSPCWSLWLRWSRRADGDEIFWSDAAKGEESSRWHSESDQRIQKPCCLKSAGYRRVLQPNNLQFLDQSYSSTFSL